MSDDSASPQELPEEIWQRVAYFVPRMKKQPHWHAWHELRSLNRTFKSAIEDYYLEHYVKRTDINIRSGELIDLYGGLSFCFSHFDDEAKRIAVFVDRDAKLYPKNKQRSRAAWLKKANEATEDPGFNANTILTVRRELTDMLPIDLKVDYTPGKCTYKFDWRTYYCTYFDEERQKAAIEESKRPEFDAAAEKLKVEVMAGRASMEDVLMQAIKLISPYAGEGAEGLFVPVRKKRRLRIGFKHPMNKEWLESSGEETRKDFAEFDEDVVLEHIKSMRQGISFIDLSDSEDGEEGKDPAEEDEEADEDDEWQDEDDEDEDVDEQEELDDDEICDNDVREYMRRQG